MNKIKNQRRDFQHSLFPAMFPEDYDAVCVGGSEPEGRSWRPFTFLEKGYRITMVRVLLLGMAEERENI